MQLSRSLLGRVTQNRLIGDSAWVAGAFAVMQALRLITNIVLAWFLTPAIFGVMTLVNALRTGVELITDVGVGQNIVVAQKGDEPAFISTAWTIQALRGGFLFILGVALSWPIAHWYERPELFPVLATVSVIFLLTGVNAPARFLMTRRREVRRMALFDLSMAVINSILSIAFAMALPSVGGMIAALIAYSTVLALASYGMMDFRILKFRIDRAHASTIVSFGKWVFFSSLVYFGATNFDRLYLPTQIPLAVFGVYGIARTFGDTATQLMQRLGGMVIFPTVARQNGELQQRMPQIVRMRTAGLALISASVGVGIAIGDLFIAVAYDQRYAAAQVILPLLLFGTWFSVQAAVAESVMMGLSRPDRAAYGNLAKLLWSVVLLPIAFASRYGLLAGFAVIALADVPRYLFLLVAQYRSNLRFVAHDAGLFVLMLAVAAGVRLLLTGAGIVDGMVSTDQLAEIAILFRAS